MSDLKNDPALLYAFEFRQGVATKLDWDGIKARESEADGFLWIGLNAHKEEARDWLSKSSGLHKLAVRSLLAEETRPRALHIGAGLVVNLRGVNLSPGASPEDMVSVRIWLESRRIICVQLRRLKALGDVRAGLSRPETTPDSAGGMLAAIAARLTDRMEPVIMEDSDKIDALEEESLEAPDKDMRLRLGRLRRNAIILRRHIAPQRDVLNHLSADQAAPLEEKIRLELRETADRVTRLVEELDSVRDRASVVSDQIADQRADEMNRNMLILSVVAAIFLPLGFVTGLLGINVGGIPGADDSAAFWIVVLFCGILGGGLMYYFHRKGWL